MSGRLTSADYQLVWPRDLFRSELHLMLNEFGEDGWEDRCELLLEDAFTGVEPRDKFAALGHPVDRRQYLAELLRHVDELNEPMLDRAPYWSERRRSRQPGAVSQASTAREFVALIRDFERRGYFEQAFDKDCVDAPAAVLPDNIFINEIGVDNVWPLDPCQLEQDPDLFCDVIEVLHDQIARPRSRSFHNYAGCGWHHGSFSLEAGRSLYRWRVNQLLDKSDMGLRLATEGDDTGRLVVVVDDSRSALMSEMVDRQDSASGDVVRHAIALFRGRSATEHDKRSAVIALSGVLESRRDLLKADLYRKDEGALFQIANEFAIRHQRADQRTDYDAAFLDWIFWWYLATIELTDRIIARQGLSAS